MRTDRDDQKANRPSLLTHFNICSGTPLSLNCCGMSRIGFTVKHWMSGFRLGKIELGELWKLQI